MLFRVLHDKLIEPGGKKSERDVIRHNGSVVILAIDNTKSKKDPWIVMERQYRHAAINICGNCRPASSMREKSRSLAPSENLRKKQAIAPKSGSRLSSTTAALDFWASR